MYARVCLCKELLKGLDDIYHFMHNERDRNESVETEQTTNIQLTEYMTGQIEPQQQTVNKIHFMLQWLKQIVDKPIHVF